MLENKFKKIKRLSFLGEKVLKVGHYADIWLKMDSIIQH